MTDQEINIAIAEECGYFAIYGKWHYPNGASFERNGRELPDYCNDLNAMHDAARTASHYRHGFWTAYTAAVLFVVKDSPILIATARQRAEAFLRAIGKWRDATPRIPKGWVRWKVGTKATGQPWFWSVDKWAISYAETGSNLYQWMENYYGPYIIPAPGSRKRNPNRKDGSK